MCVEKTPWEQVVDFHGHTCPEIAIGYRVGLIALRELGFRSAPSSKISVTAYTHSCAIDAFQVLTRATYGRGALVVVEEKQHNYHFQFDSNELQIFVKSEILEHLTGIHEHSDSRERQNKYLEAIQFILGTEETVFCTIQKNGSRQLSEERA